MQRLLDERDELAIVEARYLAYRDRFGGWRGKLQSSLESVLAKPGTNVASFDRQVKNGAVNLLLQADLAIRLYREDTGNLPSSLTDLVPAYLAAVPLDPYDGQPLRYQVEGERFVLYSVGSDGTDNGGRSDRNTWFSPTQPSGYDLNLDAVGP